MDSSLLWIGNSEFLDSLYRAYLQDPASIDPQWSAYFDGIEDASSTAAPGVGLDDSQGLTKVQASELASKQVRVQAFISANRYLGHRGADIDPIKVYERPRVPDLFLEHHGFAEDDLDSVFNTGTLHIGKREATLRENRRSPARLVPRIDWNRDRPSLLDRAKAVDPAADRDLPRATRLRRRQEAGRAALDHRGPQARGLPAPQVRRARNGSRSKAARTSSPCSTSWCRTPGLRACARWSSAWPIAGGSTCW